MTTDKILDVAEMEHGPMSEWDEAWHKDDMFVPFQPGEARDLGLEYDEYGWLDHDYRYDYPGLDDEDDLDLAYADRSYDDDDGWYGQEPDYDMPEERISMRESTVFLPEGMLIWIDSNSPGSVYIGDQANYDWHDYNGYAPFKITGECALATLASDDAIEGRWNLRVCGPMSAEAMTEMEEAKMYRQANVAREWFEHAINSARREYKGYYTRYSSTTKEVEVDGVKVEVELHTVGHNASHEFSIGILEDGRIVYKSFGEGGEGSDGETLYKESIDVLKPGETPSYIGHW